MDTPTRRHATDSESESFRALVHLAHGATLRIPPDFLVQHVLSLPGDSDWRIRRATLEAVLRRCESVERDQLRIAERPRAGAVFGTYRTRRLREAPRPYTTALASLLPMRGSCDCPDYLRNSLALCKHLLAVIDGIATRPRRFEAAVPAAAPPMTNGSRLEWDPVRPLSGRGDWLARVRWVGSAGSATNRADAALLPLRRWFRTAPEGDLVARPPAAGNDTQRAAMVADLRRVVAARPGRDRSASLGVEPALCALLDREARDLERIIADRRDRQSLQRTLRTLRRRLYPYQVEGVHRFLDTGRLLLADDMGLGKTVQAIGACHALWHSGRVRRGLVIAPATLKSQWEREWHLCTDAPVEVVDGTPEWRRSRYTRRRTGFLIVNYEQVIRDVAAIRAWSPDLVVLDEAQRIKNWATRTAASVKQLAPEYRLVLTGTPMENRLEELASILDWVDDHALEPKWRLVPVHSLTADGERETIGARYLDTLRERLAPSMLRRTRGEILRQLPPRTDTVVPVELTDGQRAEHDVLNQPIAQLAAIAQQRPLTQAQFLRLMKLLTTQRMIANGLAQIRFDGVWPQLQASRKPRSEEIQSLASPKLGELREIIAQVAIQQERKIVVFSQWRRMLALAHWAVGDLLEHAGLRAAFFTGGESQRRRTQNIVEFHDDPNLRVLFASDAGGVGLNLQRAATCCINIELPWNPAVLEQRIGRIFRLGQKRPIDVYNLVSQDCIESRIAALVGDKRALFTGLFDKQSDEVRFERSGSFLANVQRLVEAQPVELDAHAADEVEPSDPEESLVDAAAEREVAALVEAANESLEDALPADPADEETAEPAAAAAGVPASARAGVAAAVLESVEDQRLAASDLRALFSQLDVQPTSSGGLRIEAPAAAAAALATVFEGLAGLLRGATDVTPKSQVQASTPAPQGPHRAEPS